MKVLRDLGQGRPSGGQKKGPGDEGRTTGLEKVPMDWARAKTRPAKGGGVVDGTRERRKGMDGEEKRPEWNSTTQGKDCELGRGCKIHKGISGEEVYLGWQTWRPGITRGPETELERGKSNIFQTSMVSQDQSSTKTRRNRKYSNDINLIVGRDALRQLPRGVWGLRRGMGRGASHRPRTKETTI